MDEKLQAAIDLVNEELLTIKAASDLCGRRPYTIRSMVSDGRKGLDLIPAKVMGQLFVAREQVAAIKEYIETTGSRPRSIKEGPDDVGFSGRSVAQLKAMCQERGLSTSGNKGTLVERVTIYEIGLDELKGENIAALRKRLKDRGLPTNGKKADLVARLLTTPVTDEGPPKSAKKPSPRTRKPTVKKVKPAGKKTSPRTKAAVETSSDGVPTLDELLAD